MKRLRYLLLATGAMLLSYGNASASLLEYLTSTTTGGALTPSGWTTLWSGDYGTRSSYAGATETVTLPFTFVFDNVSYTQISISSHGAIGFGSSVNNSASNDLGNNGPMIAAYWDGLYIGGGAPRAGCGFYPAIRYGTIGSSPNRIFVIDYNKVSREYCDDCQFGPMFIDFQVRLYETTNKIEFQYGNMSATWPSCMQWVWGTGSTYTSGSIGLSLGTGEFISVTPSGGSGATFDRSSVNDYVDLSSSTINANTIYTFTPCSIKFTGNVAQGGTTTMADNDTLLTNISVQRGSSISVTPFTVSLPTAGCPSRTPTLSLSGAHASDFTVTPLGATSLSAGGSFAVNILFNPSALGQRTARITFSEPLAGTRTFILRATATPRISWTPDLSQGGTSGLVSGDTLLYGVVALRRTPTNFSPFTLTNYNPNALAPPANITLSIDSLGEPSTQYVLTTPASVDLSAGQSHTPVIQFTGEALGNQYARLTVNADGEIRIFHLWAISGAPGIEITNGGVVVDAGNPLYRQEFGCVGEQMMTYPLQIRNPGQFPLTITAIDIYGTDTTITQGTPPFPLLRDAQGRLQPVVDYSLTDLPAAPPMGDDPPPALPIVIGPGQSRTIYANFLAQIPGKRYARAYIRSNAENAYGTDTALGAPQNSVLGLLTIDLFARGIGSMLSSNASGLKLTPIIFNDTRVGDTAEASFTIANGGACDMRISRTKFRIASGDVNEIKLISGLTGAGIDAATDDYILPPGAVETVRVRFMPSRSGTRLARLMIQTNDSTIYHPGVAERGAYYLDVTGKGLAGLDYFDLVLDPVAIGNSVFGVARLENSENTPVVIASISFIDGDAAEFFEGSNRPWPALPYNVMPGEKLMLGVRMTPAGIAGIRRTSMLVITGSGDSITIPIRGEAGTHELSVSPTSMFDNVTIAVGQVARQTLTIANTGTLPVHIDDVRIEGADSLSYRIGVMPRLELDAGQAEYLEVTFAPTATGQSSAQIVVVANNGQSYIVALGGEAVKILVDGKDPATTTAPIKLPNAEPNTDAMRTKRPTLR